MFEPNASWSLPEHLFQVSEWSADVHAAQRPEQLRERARQPGPQPAATATRCDAAQADAPIYAWTDLTYLLHKQKVSWGYYVVPGTEPDCENDDARQLRAGAAERATRRASGTRCRTSTRSRNDHQLGNIQSVDELLRRGEDRHAARGLVGRARRAT